MKIFTTIKRIILSILLIFNLNQAVVISAVLLKEAAYVVTSVALSLSAYVLKLNSEKQKEAARRAGEIDQDLFDKILKNLDDPSPTVDVKLSDAEKEIKNILVEHYKDPIKAKEWAQECENIVADFLKIDSKNKNQTLKTVLKIIATNMPDGALKPEFESAKNYLISEFSKGTLFENIDQINEKLYFNFYAKFLECESYIVKKCWAYGVKFQPAELPKINREFLESANNKKINLLLNKSYLHNRADHAYGTDSFSNYFKINKIDQNLVLQIANVANDYQDDLSNGILRKNYALKLKSLVQQVDDKYNCLDKLVQEVNQKWDEQAAFRLFNKIQNSLNDTSIGFLTRNFNDPVADVLIKKNLADVAKGRLHLDKKVVEHLKAGILNREESLKLIKQFYGDVPKILTKEEKLWLYVIAEADTEKVLQHELIQTVYLDFNTKNYKRIYNFFYNKNGFLKKYDNNPLLQNICPNLKINKKLKKELVSNINRLLFWQESFSLGSYNHCFIEKSIEDLIVCLKTGNLDYLASGLKPLVDPNIKITDHAINAKLPLERILEDVQTAQLSEPLSAEEIVKIHEKLWEDIQLTSNPLLVLKYYTDQAGTVEAQKIMQSVIALNYYSLPRFIIEDYVFASIITIRFGNVELAGNLNVILDKHLDKIKTSGLNDNLEYALFRDEASKAMPLYYKNSNGTNARGLFTENDPQDPDHCKEFMDFLKKVAPEFKNEMAKVEKLIEEIVNDVYKNINKDKLINKKIKLTTDLDKLLHHIVHGELKNKMPSGIHFDLEELLQRCCFNLKLEEILGNGVKLMTVQSKRNGNIDKKRIFEDLKPQELAKKIYDALINKKYKIELKENKINDNKIIDHVDIIIDGIETRIDIKGNSKINTIYPAI
jgi:hypothetical protein